MALTITTQGYTKLPANAVGTKFTLGVDDIQALVVLS